MQLADELLLQAVFQDCSNCASKTGAAVLCSGCFANKTLISSLQDRLKELLAEETEGDAAESSRCISISIQLS